MESIYDSNYQSYKLNQEQNYLIAHWTLESERMRDQDFKDEMEVEIEFVKKFNIKYYLIDTLNFRFIINPELQSWTDEYVNVKLDELGLKKLAYVVSEDYIAQLSIQQTMNESVKNNYKTQFFTSMQEAENWLFG